VNAEWREDLSSGGQGAYLRQRKVGHVRKSTWDSDIWEGYCYLPGPNIFSAVGPEAAVIATVEAAISRWFSEIGIEIDEHN
jgi:hypothetical protein